MIRAACCVVLILASNLLAQENAVNSHMNSIREFGVLPENDPATNKANLQNAIDWASGRGAALFVDPSDEPYRVASGIILKMNVSLIGVHGPTGRGTKHPSKPQPVGSVFAIDDEQHPFITVEGATQIRGIQFFYPHQTTSDPARIIEYPPTIQVSREKNVFGVTLSCLTFYGEFFAIDFDCPPPTFCEQILIERINRAYDIPRILHCHVNPANQRYFRGDWGRRINDSVIARKTYAYWIDNTDNAQVIDVFTFATWGGIYLGPVTYGQMTNFNFDCVTVGIHKLGDNTFNRNWMIAQGSIIANADPEGKVENIHPIIIEGRGHTSLTNVEAFSGGNPALTAVGKSHDFMLIRGDEKLTVSIFGARMRNYEADSPITIENPHAIVQVVASIDKNEEPFELRGGTE
jgi:hypothetical protein